MLSWGGVGWGDSEVCYKTFFFGSLFFFNYVVCYFYYLFFSSGFHIFYCSILYIIYIYIFVEGGLPIDFLLFISFLFELILFFVDPGIEQ